MTRAAALVFLAGCALSHEPDPLIYDATPAEIAFECQAEAVIWDAASVPVGQRACPDHHISTRLPLEGCAARLEGWLDCSSRMSARRAWIEALAGPEACAAAFDQDRWFPARRYDCGP